MDGTPGLVTGLAGAFAGVISAWINRGAGAGVTELRTQAAKLDEKLRELEAKIAAVAADLAKLAGLPAQVQAELEAARKKYENLAGQARSQARREATASQQTLPSFEDLAQQLGVTALARDVADMKRERAETRREAVELQVELAKLQNTVELLLGGNLTVGGKQK